MKARCTNASAAALAACLLLSPSEARGAVQCARTVTADVVAFDQPLMFNRLGAQNINGMIFALRRDVVDRGTCQVPGGGFDPARCKPLTAGGSATPGNVALRPDKRPRPLVLRVAAGDCLTVRVQNLLTPAPNPFLPPVDGERFNLVVDDQQADRMVGFHVQGMQLLAGIGDDASFVGLNASSLVPPGGSAAYHLFAEREGTFLATSYGATLGGEGTQGQSSNGLWGVVSVEPPAARFYRSQVTDEEMRLATTGTAAGGQPILDYEVRYPNTEPWVSEGKAGLPVLNMLTAANEIVHGDLNAVIAGPGLDGRFPASTYPLERVGRRNPTVPNRLEAFREYTVGFHDEVADAEAFPAWYDDPILRHTLHPVGDKFMINYGSGGIGTEIIANRLGVGPMHDCLDCMAEEFFLTSYTVGDPAMVVDVPANFGLENCAPNALPVTAAGLNGIAPAGCAAVGPKAKEAFYPDDPSNVHHSYTNDFVKFRNTHTGKEHHIFHLHNHQWLYNPNDDNANYLDAQAIGPGSGYTYEINFGGSGNRNKTAGDAIFHCHFYPHFAQGMWELWRNHDVFEAGTLLAASGSATGFHSTPFALQHGKPLAGARALPDGEIEVGTPIPAIVPLPGKAMAPMPGRVSVVAKLAPDGRVLGSNAKVDRTDTDPAQVHPTLNPTGLKNPGFPFWIAGIEHSVGQRAPTPPLDMAVAPNPQNGGWDGGLPRHTLDGIAAAGGAASFTSIVSRLDFSKEIHQAKALWFPEEGTDVEKATMAFHAVRNHPSTKLLLGAPPAPADFVTNGSGRPVPGAPYHEPCIDDAGHVLNAGVAGTFFDGSGGLGTIGNSRFSADNPRVYKAANIQFDVVLNKFGYHYPQERIIALWEDAVPVISKQKPPEPLVMRNNTFDCTMFLHTNLVPKTYELDDYQVRTSTDIIGQHIHLPKWDLTTTDGSANGWNYEDGTLSPDAVRERIDAINKLNPSGAGNPNNSTGTGAGQPLVALKHPFFAATSPGGVSWLGARTTLERWFFDPVVNVSGVHRGLGVIFTHDHYGPSTHQQIGLYATVLVEPPASTWVHNETGVPLHTRADGGPTSWQAAVLTGDLDGDGRNDSFREFYLEYSDFQHAYLPGVYVGGGQFGGPGAPPDANSFRASINSSGKEAVAVAFPDTSILSALCPVVGNVAVPRPCPEAITADDPGTFVVNYRNEPVGLRVFDPLKIGPDGKPGAQADGARGDLAFALQSRTDRAIARMNVQPAAGTNINGTLFPPPINASGVGAGDPFTPMLRAYTGDRIRVKVQAGGDEETHNVVIHGVKWLQGGSGFGFSPTSGWRNAQQAGISEQFTFAAPAMPLLASLALQVDHAYTIDNANDGWWDGVWGLTRVYTLPRADLFKLPNTTVPLVPRNLLQFNGVCPRTAPVRSFDITAALAQDVLDNSVGATLVPADRSATMHVGAPVNPAGGTLVYNARATTLNNGKASPLHDPTAMMYVRTSDLVPKGAACNVASPSCAVKLRPGAPVEPISLRAAAGECVVVTLRNRLPTVAPDLAGYYELHRTVDRDRNDPQGVTFFNNNLIRPSSLVGLHPGQLAYDTFQDDGAVVGLNSAARNLAQPGGTATYRWYAGDLSLTPPTAGPAGVFLTSIVATPVELGAGNLSPADKIKQGQKGLVGSITIEPPGSTWAETDTVLDHQTRVPGVPRRTTASATVTSGSLAFRDFAAVIQKGVNHRYSDGTAVEGIAAEGPISEDTEDSGQYAVNYGSEPLWLRFGLAPNTPFNGAAPGVPTFRDIVNAHEAYSNTLSAGDDPATPVFTALAGQQARIRVVEPAGIGRAMTFNLHGHVWQRAPYVCPGSAFLGLPGNCKPTGFFPSLSGFEVGSRGIGENPLSFWLGGQDSVMPGSHYDFVLRSAGGANGIPGDYLFRDQSAFGSLGGLWGILRVR